MSDANRGPILLTAVSVILLSYFLSCVLPDLRLKWKTSHIPVINKEKGEWSDKKAVQRCAGNANGILQEGYKKASLSSRSNGLSRR